MGAWALPGQFPALRGRGGVRVGGVRVEGRVPPGEGYIPNQLSPVRPPILSRVRGGRGEGGGRQAGEG